MNREKIEALIDELTPCFFTGKLASAAKKWVTNTSGRVIQNDQ